VCARACVSYLFIYMKFGLPIRLYCV